MSYQLRKAENRLANIRRVKPILAALRTISLGSWQMARGRRSGLSRYTNELLSLLPVVLPNVIPDRRKQSRVTAERKDEMRHGVLLVLGSERGLCGRYNKVLLERIGAYHADLPAGMKVEVLALGSRLTRELVREGYEPSWSQGLSVTALPPYSLAYDLVETWLRRFEAYELDAVDVAYNADEGAGTYGPRVHRLIPPELPEPLDPEQAPGRSVLPEDVIIETDPLGLYVRIIEQWTAIMLYRLLLEAALTEHSARYQLMESATQNADDIIEELNMMVQSARRQAITREMQELAVSAGLLGNESQ